MVHLDHKHRRTFIKKTRQKIKTVYSMAQKNKEESESYEDLQCKRALKAQSIGSCSISTIPSEVESSVKSLSHQVNMFDERISNLNKKVAKMKEQANAMMKRIAQLPEVDGDANVDELMTEIEIMKDMERINLELLNFSTFMKSSQKAGGDNVFSHNQALKAPKNSLRSKGGIVCQKSKNESAEQYKDSNPKKSSSKRFFVKNSESRKSMEKPKSKKAKSKFNKISEMSEVSKVKAKEISAKNDCGQKDYTKRSKKHNQKGEKLSKGLTKGLTEDSFNLRNCQCNSSSSSMEPLSEKTPKGCNVDNIIKENEFLRNRIIDCEMELEDAKNNAIKYKGLYAKSKKDSTKPSKSVYTKLAEGLTKIRKILDSSSALPPFPETVELLKSLCLLLLDSLEVTDTKEPTEKKPNKTAVQEVISDLTSSVMDIQSFCSSVDTKNLENEEPKISLRHSMDILEKIERLMGGESSVQESISQTSFKSSSDRLNKYSLSSILNFKKLSHKLNDKNMKAYVTNIPKKDSNKKKKSCDKVYLMFVN